MPLPDTSNVPAPVKVKVTVWFRFGSLRRGCTDCSASEPWLAVPALATTGPATASERGDANATSMSCVTWR